MKLIPTKIHGALDYLTVCLLLILPALLGWDEKAARRVRMAAVGTALYSAVTRYEWGFEPLKVLPMAGHLACDGASGLLFCAAPLLLPDEPTEVKQTLMGLGLFELFVTFNSQARPGG